MSKAHFDEESQPLGLSTSGQTRRHAMLAELQDNMLRLHRARTARRRAASLAVPTILLAGLAWLCWPEPPSSGQLVTQSNPTLHPSTAPTEPVGHEHAPAFHIARVRTDPHAADRLRANVTTTAARLSDGDLIGALTAIHRPAGLVRSGDRVWLTRAVTDESSAQGG